LCFVSAEKKEQITFSL